MDKDNFGVAITVSDRCSRGEAVDESGPLLVSLLQQTSLARRFEHFLVADNQGEIEDLLRSAVSRGARVVVTTGGTGFAERDVTPEATRNVVEKLAPAFANAIVAEGLKKTAFAPLSRGIVGVCSKTLIVNLPGSTKAVRDGMVVVSLLGPHVVGLLHPEEKRLCACGEMHDSSHVHAHEGGKHNNAPEATKNAEKQVHHNHHTCTHEPAGAGNVERSSKYRMVPLSEARSTVVSEAMVLGTEIVDIESSSINGRILVDDVIAKDDLPPFTASIKDGYAVRGNHSKGERFRIVGASVAGGSLQNRTLLKDNDAIYITTGAPLPQNADAVVMIELTRKVEGQPEDEWFEILADLKAGTDVRPKGCDIAVGECVLRKGTILGAGEIAVLAAVGASSVRVTKLATLAVLSTGDELAPCSTHNLTGSQIRDSNRPMLMAQARTLKSLVGFCMDGGICSDSADLLFKKISDLLDQCDILVTSGGVSMGRSDFLKDVLVSLGCQVHYGRISMKPGKPFTFATVVWKDQRKRYILSLPGNPASAFVCFHTFAVPLLRALAGFGDRSQHSYVHATLTTQVQPDFEREELQRAVVVWSMDKQRYEASTTGIQSSSRTTNLVANALIELPVSTEPLPAGSVVKAILL